MSVACEPLADDQPPASRQGKAPEAPRKFPAEVHGEEREGAWRWLAGLPRRLFQVVFRMVPYPTRPRLIRIGRPHRGSPVLVTTNYDLTVRRVCRALRGTDCFLLVAPGGGLDVWCAAGGGRFSIASIISILKTSRIAELVDHRRLLLPQLCANGINIFELTRRTGWVGIMGPARAEDVAEFLAKRTKTEAMVRVTFTLSERLEMATAMWGSLSLRYTIFPALVFGWRAAPLFIGCVALFSVVVSVGCFVLPGKTFVQKAASPALLSAVVFSTVGLARGQGLGLWIVEGLVVVGLAAFLAGTAFPSYSPYWPCGYSKLFYGSCDLKVAVVAERCIGCAQCDRVCPVECFAPGPQHTMTLANPEVCVGCGACLIQCPTGAIVNKVAMNHLLQTADG